jgi:hypothetical protein
MVLYKAKTDARQQLPPSHRPLKKFKLHLLLLLINH